MGIIAEDENAIKQADGPLIIRRFVFSRRKTLNYGEPEYLFL